jgi:surfactin synthase thioesterase subunit
MGSVLTFEVAMCLEQDGGAPVVGVIASGRRSPTRHIDERVHLRDDAGLLAEITALSGTSMAVLQDEEIRLAVLQTLRGDYRAVETYRYQPGARLGCPLSVFTGDSDPRVSREDAWAWQELTSAAFRLREFRGGHFYLSDQWAAVARAITSELATFSTPAAAGPTPAAS